MRFKVLATSGTARRGRLDARARRRRDAGVHAGRHLRHGQGDGAGRARARSARRSCSATRSICGCGPGSRSSPRTAACIASWAGTRPILTDSGGFQVLSLGALRKVQRGRRRVRLAGQRRPAVPHARDVDADPARARLRHRDGVRRVHAVSRDARRGGGVDGAVAALGARARARVRRTRQSATRCSASCRAACTTTCATHRSPASPTIGFDGYAIGGLSVGEPKEEMLRVLDHDRRRGCPPTGRAT